MNIVKFPLLCMYILLCLMESLEHHDNSGNFVLNFMNKAKVTTE